MSNELAKNHHSATFYYHSSIPFTLLNKDIRSSSFLVTNQMLILQLEITLLGAVQKGIRSSQKSNIFYSKLHDTAYQSAEQEILIQEVVFRKIWISTTCTTPLPIWEGAGG